MLGELVKSPGEFPLVDIDYPILSEMFWWVILALMEAQLIFHHSTNFRWLKFVVNYQL